MSRKIPLFVTYGGGHAPMLTPVLKALREEGREASVLALTLAGPVFDAAGLPYMGFRDFLRPEDREARAHGERLASAMHANHAGIPREESVAYLGLSYQDLVERHGPEEAARRFREKGRMAFLPLGVLERVFDRVRPDVVVTTNSPRAELAARLVARRRGVPLIALADLLGTSSHPMDVDHLLVACASAVERYRRAPEVRAGKISVAGNPAMDRALAFAGPPDPAWRRRFPADRENARYVLAAEQAGYVRAADRVLVPWTPEEIRRNLDRVHEACRSLNAVALIRPHPSLDPAPYAAWVKTRPPGTAYLVDKEDLYPLLRSSDLVLSNNSTIMLDALYMGRPVALLRYANATTMLPFDDLGFAQPAVFEDAAGLREAMRTALEDEAARAARQAAFEAEFPPLPCVPRVLAALRERL